MKKIFYILIFISTNGISQQNLVLNPGCEDYSSCPSALGQINLLNNVSNPSTGSSDFFHNCYTGANNYANSPNNFWGYQFPLDGNAYCGISPFSFSPNVREYITFYLSDTLRANKKYNVSFFVSTGDSVKHTTDKIGTYLHPTNIFQNDFLYLPYQPQVENASGNFITDKINWIQIQGEYIAGGGEKFITIGNFYPDSLTDTMSLNNAPISSGNKAGAYFYIDDVSVIEIPDTTDTTTNPIDTTIYDILVYPNPNNGEFTLHYNLNEFSSGVFRIYNAIGQLVFAELLTQNNGTRSFQIPLAGGVYIWQVGVGEAILKREKMVIQR